MEMGRGAEEEGQVGGKAEGPLIIPGCIVYVSECNGGRIHKRRFTGWTHSAGWVEMLSSQSVGGRIGVAPKKFSADISNDYKSSKDVALSVIGRRLVWLFHRVNTTCIRFFPLI